MKTSDNGISLIAKFEGKRLTAYLDSVGVLTIGYGHTSRAGAPAVTAGMTITDQQATDILRNDVAKFEDAVSRVLKREANQNQFDAMVSLCYNIGPAAFGGSTVLADFNNGDMAGAAIAFTRWVKAGGNTLPGLVARRNTEKALFETPFKGPPSASVGSGSAIPPSPKTPPKTAPIATADPVMTWIISILKGLFK